MELSKKSLVIFCLGWLVSVVLVSLVAGYCYIEFQEEAQLSREYADMYNGLVQNYTSLLNDHLMLIQQYESEKQNLTELLERYRSCVMQVNICIDYREWNGTVVWYNNTMIPLGYDMLNATKLIAEVEYTYWSAYQASFVDAINGVSNEHPYYWMWLYWDQNEKTWKYGAVGADSYILKPDETIMWRYEIPSW